MRRLPVRFVKAGIDRCLARRPRMMAHLRDVLPPRSIGRSTARAWTNPKPMHSVAVAPGDVVMIKSSKGTGCAKIVQALIEAYPEPEAEEYGDRGKPRPQGVSGAIKSRRLTTAPWTRL